MTGADVHVSDEQLAAYYYGDEPQPAALEAHLRGCPACRRREQSLRAVLDAVQPDASPEPGPGFEQEVWTRLRPHLKVHSPWWRHWRWSAPQWALAGAMAALLPLAFYLGRWTGPAAPAGAPLAQTASAGQIRERVLLVAVGDHLQRSQMVLVELVNAPEAARVNIAQQQEMAEDLLEENRLFRQTATSNGDGRIALVLDELERVLLEVAHGPSTMTSQQLEDLRHRIEEQSVLFKVRVLGSQIQQTESRAAKPGESKL